MTRLRSPWCALVLAVAAGCATPQSPSTASAERTGDHSCTYLPPFQADKWTAGQGTTCKRLASPQVHRSCAKLRVEDVDPKRQLTTYVVTVVVTGAAEGGPPCIVTYSDGSYDVVTPLSAVPVPSSTQLTYVVVRSAPKGGGPGGDPPPPPY